MEFSRETLSFVVRKGRRLFGAWTPLCNSAAARAMY